MYGTFLPALNKKGDKYGFINEKQVRVEAGIGLMGALYSFVSVVFFAEFMIPMIIVSLLIFDFFIKIFISPSRSFLSPLSKKIASGDPYWVGVIQKRFAWSLGIVLGIFVLFCMLILSGVLNSFGVLTALFTEIQGFPIPNGMAIPMNPAIIACLLCITFMTLEAVFGYCVGCKIYQKLVVWGIIKKVEGQNCAGGVCKL